MAITYTSPESYKNDKITIFLGGTIDMGASVDWQSEIVKSFDEYENIQFLNPRRQNWDSSWVQSIHNENFVEQVEWELDGLDGADYIVFCFMPGSQSPITLLELGLYIHKPVLIYCPDSFYRKGNVDIVARRHKKPVFEDLDLLIKELKNRLA